MLDDTCHFLPCRSGEEADFPSGLLTSADNRDFLASTAFWSDKRPITSGLLRRLDIGKLAAHPGVSREYAHHVGERRCSPGITHHERSPDRERTIA